MAAAPSLLVPTPVFTLIYQGQNVTAEVSPMVTGVEYVDKLGGESGIVEVKFEDRAGNWRTAWLPARGDIFSLALGYDDGRLHDCGRFQVDEVEFEGAPDVVSMRGIETPITPDLRTERSLGYEGKTLLEIAQEIASRHGLTLVGAPAELNVTYARITQSRESDLEFLHRLAETHGYEFTVRGGQLIFYARKALEQQAPATAISYNQVSHYRARLLSLRTFNRATATYFDPVTKSLMSATHVSEQAPAGDTLRPIQRVENRQQAAARAAAQLHGHNMLEATAEVKLPGNPALVAGIVVTLNRFGKAIDGNYLVTETRHQIDRKRGYATTLKLRTANVGVTG